MEATVAPALTPSPADGSLVIGIGNPLRGDDGVGWRLVDALGEPHLALHQLTPDCALRLAGCRRVLFVDAWLAAPCGVDGAEEADGQGGRSPAGREPVLRPLQAAPAAAGLSHHLRPAQLLWLSERLFGCSPDAWQLLIPAVSLGHSEAFSPSLQALLPQAQALLRGWLQPNTVDLAIQEAGGA